MNDRFKIRMWDKNIKKMRTFENDFMLECSFECLKQQLCYDSKIEDLERVAYDHIKDGRIFMQCTGLKDKNDKLIYEDDIVRESFGETGTYRVEFFPYSAEWQYVNFNDEEPNWEMLSMQFEGMGENQGISTDLEIIGNIYENPELLEREV